MAELDLLRRGATLFGWTIDEERVDGLMDQARALNEASAEAYAREQSPPR